MSMNSFLRRFISSPVFAFVASGIVSHASLADDNYATGQDAESVLGQVDFTSNGSATTQNGLQEPCGIAIDPATSKLFVADTNNHRVVRFSSADSLADGANAEAVLGQANFTSGSQGTGASTMWYPRGLHVDSGGRLWVADSNNHRVLRFDNATTIASGSSANGVLGQPNLTTRTLMTTQSGMYHPDDVYVDSSGTLWVADATNSRVLRFDNAATLPNGSNANAVLGQPDFTTSTGTTTRNGMWNPRGLTMDSSGRLYVAEWWNHRVTWFDIPSAKANGADADGVLGQENFTTRNQGFDTYGLDGPEGLTVDGRGRLWVAEEGGSRVKWYEDLPQLVNRSPSDGVLGQPASNTNATATTRDGMHFAMDVAALGNDRLWIVDRRNNRVLRFDEHLYQPDLWIGTKSGNQKGNNVHSPSGAGQKISVVARGNRKGKFFFTVENDGDIDDTYEVLGSRGNAKLDVSYRQTSPVGANVTGAMTRNGRVLQNVAPGSTAKFRATVKGTRKSRGKRASRTFTIRAISRADFTSDAGKAKVKKKP